MAKKLRTLLKSSGSGLSRPGHSTVSRLAPYYELIRAAIRRAADGLKLETSIQEIGDGHWVFAMSSPYTKGRGNPESALGAIESDDEKPGPVAPRKSISQTAQPATPGDSNLEDLLCPSFAPFVPGIGSVFGVVVGDAVSPQLVRLTHEVPVTKEIFDLTAPFHPSEIFRIAAPCVGEECKNFGGGICHLGRNASQRAPDNSELPACVIRPRCLWWRQEGPAACATCTSMVTNSGETFKIRQRLGN